MLPPAPPSVLLLLLLLLQTGFNAFSVHSTSTAAATFFA